MKNNLLRCLEAACLTLFTVAAIAQPAVGTALPAPPSATELLAREKTFFEKAKQLKAAEAEYEASKLAFIQSELLQWGTPKMSVAAQETALQKRAYPGYLVGFSAEHRQPQWSYHAIERDIFDVCLEREENFFEDLSLTGAARLSQYRSSGFQRGHMAPAADFRWSPKASVASNTLSNIAPQSSELNEGLWAELEISVRHYLQVRDSLGELLVVTGPLLESGLKKLKDTTGVSIPKKFFKVVVNLKDQQGFAFLMESSAQKADPDQIEAELRKRAMSIESLEKLLRINFFPNFTTAQVKNIESKLDMDEWFAVPGESLGHIPPAITDPRLLTDAFNTAAITPQNLKSKKAVVGTITKVSVGPSGGVTLFLDDHRVLVQVLASDAAKFNNPALKEMLGKVVRVEGTISADGDRFKMSVRDPLKLVVLK